MANLGNTIINGVLRVNGKINSSDVISAPSFVGALTGNADTATKLATARTINGVSFDGSANITTANWGTARNIGIVNSDGTGTAVTVSVNGSGNINLKLPDTIKASLTGNADTATKLQTARTITNGGELTGSFSFDGSGNVTNTAYIRYAKATKGNTSTYPFCRIATSGVLTGQFQDKVSLIYITQDFIGGSFGLIRVTVRTNESTSTATAEAKWLIRSGFAADNVQIGLYNVYGKTYLDVFCKINGAYGSITARFLDGTRGNVGQQWTLISSYETDNGATHSECYKTIQGTTAGAAAQDLHSGIQYTNVISGTDAGIVSVSNSTSGNAATATKLATARTINGTNFDGSGNITTANWGTARNVGIVNSDGTGTAVTVSVNGSGNVNLKLPATIKASLTGNATNVTQKKSLTSKSHSNYGTNNGYLPDMSFIAFWNGAFNGNNSSNLTYAHQGVIQCKPTTLYDNSSGTTGTVTLSETAANFNYLELYYCDNNNRQHRSVRIANPNNKIVTLDTAEAYDKDKNIYVRTTNYTISNKSITVRAYMYMNFWQFSGGEDCGVDVEKSNYIKIVKVLGYK